MKISAKVWLEIAGGIAGALGAGPIGPAVGKALGGVVDYLGKLKENAQRTGEWTVEERKAVDARWVELENSKAWKTDQEGG